MRFLLFLAALLLVQIPAHAQSEAQILAESSRLIAQAERASTAQAIPMLRRALALRQRVYLERSFAVGEVLSKLATRVDESGDHIEAEALFRRVVANIIGLGGGEHPRAASAYVNLALTQEAQRHYGDAVPSYRAALRIAFLSRSDEAGEIAHDFVTCLIDMGDLAGAERLARQNLEVFQTRFRQQPVQLAHGYRSLAYVLHAEARDSEAVAAMWQAVRIQTATLPPNDRRLAKSYNDLAMLLPTADSEQRARLYLKAIEILVALDGPDSASVANVYNNLTLGQPTAQAEAVIRKVLAARIAAHGENHRLVAQSYTNLGMNLSDRGRRREAVPFLAKAVVIYERVLGPNDPDTALGYTNLAGNYLDLGEFALSESNFRRALAIVERGRAPDAPEVIASHRDLGFALGKIGRRRFEAVGEYRKVRAGIALRLDALGRHGPTPEDVAAFRGYFTEYVQVAWAAAASR